MCAFLPRQQKARNWTTGTWWAERGIEAYGADALSQDWVDDLKKRAAYLRGKLDLENAPKPVGPSRIGMTPSSTDSGSTFETLICGQCGREWQRAVVRGRKPHVCDDCRRAV